MHWFSDTHACIMARGESKKAADFLDHWYRALLAEHGDEVHVRTSCVHVQDGVQKGEKDIPIRFAHDDELAPFRRALF